MAKKVKTLVMTVDRDDDLGKKTRIKGPVVGEKQCIKAAEELAISDPGESDANAMFGTIKAFKELKSIGESVEVAIITGHPSRGIKADREVANQLNKLKEEFNFDEVVLVTDGADDEQLIPVIQGITKIANVQRVVIKQSQAIEGSFYLLKEVIKDPHFARIIFGLPGVAMFIYALLYLLGVGRLSFNISLGVIGAYLMIKGFGIEDMFIDWFSRFKKTASIERASFPIYLAAVFMVILAIWSGANSASYYHIQMSINGVHNQTVEFIGFLYGTLGMFTLATMMYVTGRIVDMYHRGEVIKIRRYSRSLVTILSAYLILDIFFRFAISWSSQVFPGPTFLDVLMVIVLTTLVALFGFSIVSKLYRKFLIRHIKKKMRITREGREIGVVQKLKVNKIIALEGEKKIEIPFGKVLSLRHDEIEVA